MNSFANVYMKNQVQTNSPENLVLMLYDGAKKFTGRGIKAMEENNIEEANNNLVRSQDILAELMAGINFEAGELAENLFALYEYMHYRLIQANLKKDKEPAEEVLVMMSELRDTWAQMLKERNSLKGTLSEQKIAGAGI